MEYLESVRSLDCALICQRRIWKPPTLAMGPFELKYLNSNKNMKNSSITNIWKKLLIYQKETHFEELK